MNLWLIKFVTTGQVELMVVRKEQQQDTCPITHWDSSFCLSCVPLSTMLQLLCWTVLMGKALPCLNLFQINTCLEQIYFNC